MDYNIVVSKLAEFDILNIKKYIKYILLNEYSANRIVENIVKQILDLNTFPKKCAVFITLEGKAIRRLTVEKYNVYYFVDENNFIINVLRVVYGGVDLSQIAIS